MMPSHFWNKDYLLMCLSGMLATAGIFLQFWLLLRGKGDVAGGSALVAMLALGLFAVGLFVLGPFSAWWVDVFRRKNLCLWALAGLVALASGQHAQWVGLGAPWVYGGLGMCFGLLQMALGSTLINDLSISLRRTQTDYYYLWACRLGVLLGLLLARWPWVPVAWPSVTLLPVLCYAIAAVALLFVHVPFRAPSGVARLSLDRFLYLGAWPLSVGLLLVGTILGVTLRGVNSAEGLLCVAAGLVVALITHRHFFESADPRADAVAGFLLMAIAQLILLWSGSAHGLYFAHILFGVGWGWLSSRFILCFLKLSAHCQRGTLQQTYTLSFYVGLCAGLVLCLMGVASRSLVLVLLTGALVYYLLLLWPWYKRRAARDFKFREV